MEIREPASAIANADDELALSVGATQLHYRELDLLHQSPSHYLDADSGTQPLVEGSWRRQGSLAGLDNIYTGVDVDYARGHTAYSGYTIDPASRSGIGAPVEQGYTGMQFDAGLRLGRAVPVGAARRLQITPYLAYRFHDWTRNALERYRHQAAGIGVLCQYALTSSLVAEADVTVARTFDARMHTPGLPAAVLGSRYDDAAGLGLDLALSERLHVRLGYRIERFGYGNSATASGYYGQQYGRWFEPTSRTWLQTASLGLAWSP